MQVDITKLEKQMKSLLKDYSDLMDVKVTLDMEIVAYRKLLQAEEVSTFFKFLQTFLRSDLKPETTGSRNYNQFVPQ